jgi:hypothetical protein
MERHQWLAKAHRSALLVKKKSPHPPLCHTPTWTQLARSALALVLLPAIAACSFRDYEYSSPSGSAGAPLACKPWSAWSRARSGTPVVDTGAHTLSGPISPASIGACDSANSPSLVDSGTPVDFGTPACDGTNDTNAANYASVLAHWTFNQSLSETVSSGIYDETNAYALYFRTDQPGSSASVPQLDNLVRVNGVGSSIYLDGHHYYESADPTAGPSIDAGMTIAALISLSQDGLPVPELGGATIWPILSTLSSDSSEECGGYQLDIRLDCAAGPEVVFTYKHVSSDSAVTCQTASLALPLDKPSWAWGTGHWHHVAATYTPTNANRAGVSLYWDSDSYSAYVTDDVWVDGQMSPSTSDLYIGSNAGEAQDPARQKFKGNIDEIVMFNRPLGQAELAKYSINASTFAGPSGCRWQASETRQDGVDAGVSTTSWGCVDSNQLQVTISDQDWGAGAISARLSAPGTTKDLTQYGQIILTADGVDAAETPNGSFEFALSAGDSSCTWYVPGNKTGVYRIDLANPGYCQTDPNVCQFAINKVEWASIRSSWEYPTHFDSDPSRYSIYQLDLVKGDKPLEPGRYGGIRGPNNWCWRTQAFQTKLGAAAIFDHDAGATASNISAVLSGYRQSSSAVVADFGDETIDLHGCAEIALNAQLTPPEIVSTLNYYPGVTLQGRLGSWAQWNWNAQLDAIDITHTPVVSSEAANFPFYGKYEYWPPYAYFPRFDRANTTLLAIQKTWAWPNTSETDGSTANLTIDGVAFLPAGCEKVNHP